METAGKPEKSGQVVGLISTGKLTHYWAYTSGLLPGSLPGVSKGTLILKEASRLDAFSAYPVRT